MKMIVVENEIYMARGHKRQVGREREAGPYYDPTDDPSMVQVGEEQTMS